MKRWIVMLVAFALVAGFVQADRGIDPTPETQGIVTLTTFRGVGSILSNSDISMSTTDDEKGLRGIPPLEGSGYESEYHYYGPGGSTLLAQENGATLYNAVYRETTHSNGVGVIEYTKILEADTSVKTIGQSNIDAFKQVSYSGGNTGRIYSEDVLSVDGTATPDPLWWISVGVFMPAPDRPTSCSRSICGFLCSEPPVIPAFCNSADTGSSIDMTQVHLTTQSSARFITTGSDTPVRLSHDIRVIDSLGKASAGFDIVAMESRPVEDLVSGWVFGVTVYRGESRSDLYQTTSFSESTRVDGTITIFDKSMVYESGIRR